MPLDAASCTFAFIPESTERFELAKPIVPEAFYAYDMQGNPVQHVLSATAS